MLTVAPMPSISVIVWNDNREDKTVTPNRENLLLYFVHDTEMAMCVAQLPFNLQRTLPTGHVWKSPLLCATTVKMAMVSSTPSVIQTDATAVRDLAAVIPLAGHQSKTQFETFNLARAQ